MKEREKKDDANRAQLAKALSQNNNTMRAMAIAFIRKEIFDATMKKTDLDLEGKLTDATEKMMDAHIEALKEQLYNETNDNEEQHSKKSKGTKRKLVETIELLGDSSSSSEEED